MDVSKTATIGRRSQNTHALRDLRAQLAIAGEEHQERSKISESHSSVQEAGPHSAQETEHVQNDQGNDSGSESSSDVEDIDRETAIITVYNLLSNLGDLNQSNRWVAEGLAQKFSSLQTQVDRAESLVTEESWRLRSVHSGSSPADSSDRQAQDDSGGAEALAHMSRGASLTASSANRSESTTFHTPPTQAAQLPQESPLAETVMAEMGVQTDMRSLDVVELSRRAQRLADENAQLRDDVALLVRSLREHHGMAKDYETALSRALTALRTVAFERDVEISNVRDRYRDLLATESLLNERLSAENVDLRGALSNAASAMRVSLAESEEETRRHAAGDNSSANSSRGRANGHV
ncbi:hypothetical protein GGI07_001736 [Coemansia sp. Benny D115]|nr:hypothetical protein GGI07_001736 [Coemansia sp. Benny D115]